MFSRNKKADKKVFIKRSNNEHSVVTHMLSPQPSKMEAEQLGNSGFQANLGYMRI